MHYFLDPIVDFIHGDGLTILPQMELLLFALGILIFDFLLEKNEKQFNAYLALTGVAASALGVYMQYKKFDAINSGSVIGGQVLGFHDTVIIDSFALFFSILLLAATALAILLSTHFFENEQGQEGEYYSLLLLACVGMMFMVNGIDLIVEFLGLEIMALSLYLLAGFLRQEKRSNEAAVKYFILGSFGTGILVYGFSLLYGVSSSTNVIQIGDVLDKRLRYTSAHALTDWLVILAFVTIAAGMFFKIAAAPFHQWAADVTEGAPTPISAYVSVVSITASFGLFLRLLSSVFSASQPTWLYVIAGIAVVSLTWGTLAALTQNNLKRMLAYSSVAHVGYLLLGVAAWNEPGFVGIFYYLLAYAFMTFGAFAIVTVLHQRGVIGTELSDLDGLYQRSPAAALLLLLFGLSLAGIPPTAGFLGKYFIFQSLIQSHHPVLAVIAALYVLPGIYIYFRVIQHAWMKKPGADSAVPIITTPQLFALILTAFVTLAAGLYPEPFTYLVRYALGLTHVPGQ
jgi:NADH-quinone oxidoreductase subunit N